MLDSCRGDYIWRRCHRCSLISTDLLVCRLAARVCGGAWRHLCCGPRSTRPWWQPNLRGELAAAAGCGQRARGTCKRVSCAAVQPCVPCGRGTLSQRPAPSLYGGGGMGHGVVSAVQVHGPAARLYTVLLAWARIRYWSMCAMLYDERPCMHSLLWSMYPVGAQHITTGVRMAVWQDEHDVAYACATASERRIPCKHSQLYCYNHCFGLCSPSTSSVLLQFDIQVPVYGPCEPL